MKRLMGDVAWVLLATATLVEQRSVAVETRDGNVPTTPGEDGRMGGLMGWGSLDPWVRQVLTWGCAYEHLARQTASYLVADADPVVPEADLTRVSAACRALPAYAITSNIAAAFRPPEQHRLPQDSKQPPRLASQPV